jgi:phosphatidylserine/phosphatidylglycerophosphate/cardiolipin synthase-like enzyme
VVPRVAAAAGADRTPSYPHTLLHQKVMTLDGVWTAIGSSNFDDRSLETNDEMTLAIKHAALVRRDLREIRAAGAGGREFL